MTLMNVFLERYIMNITASMISRHHSVLTIYDLKAIYLNYLGVHQNCIKNLFYLDVCLNMCSFAIRYAWFCTSVCIFFFFLLSQCLHVFFLYHVYVEVFSMVTSAYTFVLCSIKINHHFGDDSFFPGSRLHWYCLTTTTKIK